MSQDLKLVQETLDNFLSTNDRVTGAKLHEVIQHQLSEKLKDLVAFRMAMAGWFKDGSLKGYEARLGRTGGIYRVGAPSKKVNDCVDSVKTVIEPTETNSNDTENGVEADGEAVNVESSAAIMLPGNQRIIQGDRFNWVVQKLSGDNWANRGYYPNMAAALRGAVRGLVNKELSAQLNEKVTLEKMAKLIEKVESSLLQKLTPSS